MTSPATREAFRRSVEIENQGGIDPVGSALRSLNDALQRPTHLPTIHEMTWWAEGHVARLQGETLDRCPYARGDVTSNWWRLGWAEADEEMRHLTADEVRDLIHDITADYLTEPDYWDEDPYEGPDTFEEAR